MNEEIKNGQADAPAKVADHDATMTSKIISNKIESVPMQEPMIKEREVKTMPEKSFIETVKAMGICIVKQAPGVLKTSLTLAGKGAEAMGKALHKMSDMVPVNANADTAATDQKTSASSEKATDKDA